MQLNTLMQIIKQGAVELGVNLPISAYTAFGTYHTFLEERGKNVNLTAIKSAQDVAKLHFLDSLALLRAADFRNAKVIDIGSGAGFPGLPLKIAEPSIKLTLLDASAKRVKFLSDLCAALGIDAMCIHARAEESAQKKEMRELFDIVVSRAVARLNVLCELCLPYLRIGGLFLAMKTTESADELDEARGALQVLGAEYLNHMDYIIPGTEIKHRVLIIKKSSLTPEAYPRRFARINKTPLL